MIRLLRTILLLSLLLAAALYAVLQAVTWRPEPREKLPVSCRADAPVLVPGQALKVMSWNVQFLAGKRYVFWYDAPQGQDERPSREDLAYTLDEVVRVIRDEAPDLVLLQDVDDNARATGHQDQLALLQERVVDLYPCAAQAFDWKADFVPDPHVLGSVGRKLVTLSRFNIKQASRLQLPQRPAPWYSEPFEPRRAVLTAYLPLRDGGQVAVLNTQLSTYSADDDVQAQQVQALVKRVDKLESLGTPWLLGGNLNLLPLGQHRRLAADEQAHYSPDSDLHLLWDKYPMIPSNAEASGAERADWFTRFPNGAQGPDRTQDYLIHSPRLQRVDARVRQDDTLGISDHLPVLGRFLLPVAVEAP